MNSRWLSKSSSNAVGLLRMASVAVVLAGCAETTPPATPPPAPPAAPTAITAPPVAEEPTPALRLPSDVHPLAESLELHIDPRQERFSGAVDIDVKLDRPRSTIFLHGKDMRVTAASVAPEGGAPVTAVWQERHESGMAALALAGTVPAGNARLHVVFDAPFGRGQKGLYRSSEAGVEYAFTQFEAIAARLAFPCFDEPGFKIPFTTTLVVPAEMQAIANTREVSRVHEGQDVRVSFAPTLPLPSYLVAFAVGPLDVVPVADVPPDATRAKPLPLRGVAPRGRGKDMAYALAHTGEILTLLEQYTGIGYPWDKLDIIAVPGKGGAMENAGAVTFGERLVLLDAANATVSQRRTYAGVMAHELAHQWTGDLVTMAWWDDTWLNEAFATWIGNKIAQTWDPKIHADVSLLRGVQGAMGTDALVSARAIRQRIESPDDIENAFDGITYQKGGGVLAMFERYVGPEIWQKGLHAYLEAHRFGNATADDFLDAESAASGQDVKTAFHTFLDRPGVPFLDVSTSCKAGKASVEVKQSRYLPIGSTGNADQLWQVPFCMRVNGGSPECKLLKTADTTIDLAPGTRCPVDVFPNADAAGYFRFGLAPADLATLRKHLGRLSTREKIAYAGSLRASFARATTSMKDVLEATAQLASDPDPAVADEPMGYVSTARDWLYATPLRARTERYAQELYQPVARRLGWTSKKDESDEARTLRAVALSFLAQTGRDPAVRAEARRRGLAYVGAGKDWAVHADAVEPDLAGISLAVAGNGADRATWEGFKKMLAGTVDEAVRGRLVYALSVPEDPQLAAAARELALDPMLRDNELLTPFYAQLQNPAMRDAAWAWVKEHYDALLARLPRHHSGVQLIGTGGVFCDEAHARDVEEFFRSKVASIEGGPRALASTVESVRLCAARRAAQESSAKEFFGERR